MRRYQENIETSGDRDALIADLAGKRRATRLALLRTRDPRAVAATGEALLDYLADATDLDNLVIGATAPQPDYPALGRFISDVVHAVVEGEAEGSAVLRVERIAAAAASGAQAALAVAVAPARTAPGIAPSWRAIAAGVRRWLRAARDAVTPTRRMPVHPANATADAELKVLRYEHGRMREMLDVASGEMADAVRVQIQLVDALKLARDEHRRAYPAPALYARHDRACSTCAAIDAALAAAGAA